MLDTVRELTLTENLDVIKKPGQIKNALAFHKEILEAILAQDARRARRKMIEHLEDIENTVIELIEGRHQDQVKGVEQGH
jgi:DNA-binding FadR family transcriptional regulator